MAYAYTWPITLPQNPDTNYSESGGMNILRSPMDAGPAKQRKRGNKPQTMSVSFLMSTSQVTIFESFVKTTLNGTARFGFTSPKTGSVVEVRIVPSSDGALYNIAYVSPVRWSVQFQMEILP